MQSDAHLGHVLATPVIAGRLDVCHPILHEGQREDEERERHESDHHLLGGRGSAVVSTCMPRENIDEGDECTLQK
jgi:hypothetical protein